MNSSRVYLERFARECAAQVGPGDLVLDAGAGSAPYKHLFPAESYESVDFEKTPGKHYAPSNYIADLTDLPMDDDRYRIVLLNQVLEHLPEPIEALKELRRVLEPGGEIWASQPLYYEEHDIPFDFYRYTSFGLKYVFETAGFVDVKVEWLEGYFGTLSYQLAVAGRAMPRGGKLLTALSKLFGRMDLKRKVTTVGHPKNYTVVARVA
jgi:SAM-dependent methyltransferase